MLSEAEHRNFLKVYFFFWGSQNKDCDICRTYESRQGQTFSVHYRKKDDTIAVGYTLFKDWQLRWLFSDFIVKPTALFPFCFQWLLFLYTGGSGPISIGANFIRRSAFVNTISLMCLVGAVCHLSIDRKTSKISHTLTFDIVLKNTNLSSK